MNIDEKIRKETLRARSNGIGEVKRKTVMENIKDTLSWIWENIWSIFLIGILVYNIRGILRMFLYEPIQGEDGRVSIEELGKYVFIVIFAVAAFNDFNREHEWRYFTDQWYLFIGGIVAAIAAVQRFSKAWENQSNKPKDTKK